MSLTSFLNMADVKAKLTAIRPKLPRKVAVPVKVEPRSNRYGMVGSAFDYLLRFELQRRAPHAVTRPWAAEQALGRTIWLQEHFLRQVLEEKGEEFLGVNFDSLDTNFGELYELFQEDVDRKSQEATECMRAVVEEAKSAVAAYVKNTSPTRREQADVAAHAIQLAKLDVVYRAHKLDPSFEVADPEDVEDLLSLLAVVPIEALFHDKILLLNPVFGHAAALVGGADTDLIAGDMLVDFKTTKTSELQTRDLDQLFGYYLLAHHQRKTDPTFPEIKRLSLYFCRHGHLWIEDATTWTDNSQFAEVEKWFFERAQGLHGQPRQVGRS